MLNRGNLVFALGVLLIVGLVVLASRFLLSDTDAPEVAVQQPVSRGPAPKVVTFAQVEGTVEVQKGADTWQVARLGAPVNPGTSVRTGADSSAAVSYGDNIQVQLQSGSRVRLDSGEEHVVKLVVREGAVSADVRAGDTRLRLLSEDGNSLVETGDGAIHVLADGHGDLQAAVSRGAARVQAAGQTVLLGTGQKTTVHAGGAPDAPTPIPASLFLHVEWPVDGATAKRLHRVTGVATPGAQVSVGKERVTADAKGRFFAVVELREGKNEIHVRAFDVLGRSQSEVSPPWILDTSAPTHAVETNPNMWQRLDATRETVP